VVDDFDVVVVALARYAHWKVRKSVSNDEGNDLSIHASIHPSIQPAIPSWWVVGFEKQKQWN
jgi:hypothetical protein